MPIVRHTADIAVLRTCQLHGAGANEMGLIAQVAGTNGGIGFAVRHPGVWIGGETWILQLGAFECCTQFSMILW